MSGDWIKMRGALMNHPKVVAISRHLQDNRAFRSWLTPGGEHPTNGQIVSDSALRCVTCAVLLRVWSAAREHGHFAGDDLILPHICIDDLDQIAEVPGIGQAMAAVGWASNENGVTLYNFKEYNVPKSHAERQKDYRGRQKKGSDGALSNRDVENVTSSTLLSSKSSPSSPDQKGNAKGKGLPSSRIEAIYIAYPRSVGKRDALKAITAAVKAIATAKGITADAAAAWLMDRVKAYADSPAGQAGKFTPHPATWMNKGQYDDDDAEWQRAIDDGKPKKDPGGAFGRLKHRPDIDKQEADDAARAMG